MGKFEHGNLRRVYRYQVVLLFLLVGLGLSAQMGSSKSYNYNNFKNKGVYYGIGIGINNSSFIVNHSNSFIDNDSIAINQSLKNPGLTFQGIFNLKLGAYFDFRVLAGFSLSERSLEFYRPNDPNPYLRERIEFVYADIPFLLRYKSAPFKDKRAFVVGGIKYTYDVNGFSRGRNADDIITVTPHDFALEFGAGIQFFFPYFILSPEIKVSQGIGNVLRFNNSLDESRVIDSLLSRTLSITFHFEG